MLYRNIIINTPLSEFLKDKLNDEDFQTYLSLLTEEYNKIVGLDVTDVLGVNRFYSYQECVDILKQVNTCYAVDSLYTALEDVCKKDLPEAMIEKVEAYLKYTLGDLFIKYCLFYFQQGRVHYELIDSVCKELTTNTTVLNNFFSTNVDNFYYKEELNVFIVDILSEEFEHEYYIKVAKSVKDKLTEADYGRLCDQINNYLIKLVKLTNVDIMNLWVKYDRNDLDKVNVNLTVTKNITYF